jgi:uncharacterized cofD-like protein
MKKVVIFGGGSGLSQLLKGIIQFPMDVTAVVSVSDNGASTGRLREEFAIPAVGDITKVLMAMSGESKGVKELFSYRFPKDSSIGNHSIKNLIMTALLDMKGNFAQSLPILCDLLDVKGKLLPLTEDNVTLMAVMDDNSIVEGEHNITASPLKVKDIYYKEEPVVPKEVIKAIKEADMIILSMGSLYTSISCNLICDDVRKAIDTSKGKLLYVCNMFTQPGETDDFKVSDHLKVLNSYLGERKIETVIANSGKIPQSFIDKYHREEEKDPVLIDEENLKLMDVKLIHDDFVMKKSDSLKHDAIKLSLKIFEEIIK